MAGFFVGGGGHWVSLGKKKSYIVSFFLYVGLYDWWFIGYHMIISQDYRPLPIFSY